MSLVASHTTKLNSLIYTGYASIERGLDIVGYIPGLNFVGSSLRSTLAITQLVHAAALYTISLFSQLLEKITKQPIVLRSSLQKEALEVAKNGALNLIRSVVESFFILGSAICLAYDINKAGFSSTFLCSLFGSTIISPEYHRPLLVHAYKYERSSKLMDNIRLGVSSAFVAMAAGFASAAYLSWPQANTSKDDASQILTQKLAKQLPSALRMLAPKSESVASVA